MGDRTMRMFILLLIFGNDIEAISGFKTKHECERPPA